MQTHKIAYAGSAYPVKGLGPGRRVVIWVSGCRRNCPGCLSPELHARGPAVAIGEAAAEIGDWLAEADGLTISGGEPFEQAEPLAALVKLLRRRTDCECLVYTGYLLAELRQLGPAAAGLLAVTDLLVDGPYKQEYSDELIWRGSDNQRLHLLSARAQRYQEYVEMRWPRQRPLQLQNIEPFGVRIIGIPRRGDSELLHSSLHAAGFNLINTNRREPGNG